METYLSHVVYLEAELMIIKQPEELKVKSFVRSDVEGHEKYHQDTFDAQAPHYHLKYNKNLDDKKLAKIITVLENHEVLSEEEGVIFLASYRALNNEAKQYACHSIPSSSVFFKKISQRINFANTHEPLSP